MKKVAIFTHALWTNGATKSLIELLKRIDLEKCEIDLYVLDFSNPTEWVDEIPKQIHIKAVPRYNFSKETIKDIFSHPILFLKALYSGIMLNGNLTEVQYMKYTAARLPFLRGKYDIAISYRHFDIDVFYVNNNINASSKYFFVHGVQKLTQEEIRELKNVYIRYDAIFPVSVAAKENIVEQIPEIQAQCRVAYCVVEPNEIVRRSQRGVKFNTKGNVWKIFTIGRLSQEKGIKLVVEACKLLKMAGYNIEWRVAGEGPQREMLEQLIKSEKLENEFLLLGNIANPYGLLSTCDIYVQPSLMESYGLTINEAKIFNKPIVCTDIPAAREQIINNQTGLLVSANAKNIAHAVCRYIDNPVFRENICNNLSKEDKSHYESVIIFNSLLE